MDIWSASLSTADRANVWGYGALVVGTVTGLVATTILASVPAAIAGATLIVVGTFIVFWASSIRSRMGDRQIADAQKQVAIANQKTAELEASAQASRLEQARLLQDTVVLERQLEEERKSRLRVQAEVAWRALSVDQHDALVHALQGCSFEVNIGVLGRDPEAILFADAIVATLAEAGLKPMRYTGYELALGLTISNKGLPEETILREAFEAAGIRLDEKEPGGHEMAGESRPQITIGTKPPVFLTVGNGVSAPA